MPAPKSVSVFQPTRPRGARPAAVHPYRQPRQVSTHAPTRGATWIAMHPHCGWCGFNPRAHAGRDFLDLADGLQARVFQPTRPRGARLAGVWQDPGGAGFQPTRPRGARHHGRHAEDDLHPVSTHAPTRGATRFAACTQHPAVAFQPTRPRGARQGPRTSVRLRACFNPRAHAGRDPKASAGQSPALGFNPRAHAGRDSRMARSTAWVVPFQPTRPRGARHDFGHVGLRCRSVSTHAPTRGATGTDAV